MYISLMLHNDVTFLRGILFLIPCHIYCSIRKALPQKSPKGLGVGGSVFNHLIFEENTIDPDSPFMNHYGLKYRVIKCTLSADVRVDNTLNKAHSFQRKICC